MREFLAALRRATTIQDEPLPFWRRSSNFALPTNLPPAKECVSFPNGILHLPTGELIEPTAFFFTYNALTFDYDADATCALWKKTLRDYWADNPDGSPADEILLLQEIFGYLILGWTDLQRVTRLQ
jgi:phage/plasmid-associated DNA primase